jgi:hypothetical protein
LSTTNTHIDVGEGEIKFNINGKKERFAFKPRPELTANMVLQEKDQSSEPPSPGPHNAFED